MSAEAAGAREALPYCLVLSGGAALIYEQSRFHRLTPLRKKPKQRTDDNTPSKVMSPHDTCDENRAPATLTADANRVRQVLFNLLADVAQSLLDPRLKS